MPIYKMIRVKLYIIDIYIFLSKYFGKYITCYVL